MSYATVESAQRLGATLSICLRGRISVIDVGSHSIGVIAYTSERSETCNFVGMI